MGDLFSSELAAFLGVTVTDTAYTNVEPAGTIHSFAHAANNTRMMGILNPPVFEKFSEYMNYPTDAYVQQQGGEFYFPAEGFGRACEELDLVVVGPPPGTPGQ